MKIELCNISKNYKRDVALKNFSTVFHPGVYGLLGANGAGKTTLINIMVGILQSSQGEIFVDGVNIKKMGKNYIREIGYLPQYPQFYPDFLVKDFLDYMCALKGIPAKEGKERVKMLMSAVNLSDAEEMKIGSLSGGMRQRVGIVQALLGQPKLLILDEPTAGLDPQERIRFRNLISQFAEDRIVLLATHIVSDVDAIANEVLLLKKGTLIKQDTPERLTNELAGKVWEIVLTEEQKLSDFNGYQISNVQRNGNELHIRLLAEKKPVENATLVSAGLEDVFLYYFGES